MPDDLDRIAAALAAVAEDNDARMLADAIWLAATAPPPVQGPSNPRYEPLRDTPNRDGTTPPASRASRQTSAAMPLSERRISGPLVRGVPVRVQVPPPLPQAAAIARALRPFTRPWQQGTATQLDVEATIDRYTEHGVLTPILRTAPERWFDVVVVVDDAPTMAVWRDTISEFTRVIACTGFFRAVHRWTLTGTEVKDHLGRTTAVADAAAMARVPNARRLVLIVSDFAKTVWRGPTLWGLVREWARAASVALVNPLPVRFWTQSGMDLPAVRATATCVPGPTSTLQFRWPLRARLTGDSLLPVPALALTPAALDRWARTIVRTDPDGCDAVLVPARRTTPPQATAAPGPAAEAFLHTASTPAARLALLSAPFEHFSLPLLRLLHANAVPEAEPADLAELLISGLATIDDPRAEVPVLTYHPAARDHLLNHVTTDDVWTAHQALTSFISAHPDVTPSMLALAHTPQGQEALPAELNPFAMATADTLRLLGVLPEETPAPSDASTRGVKTPPGTPASIVRFEEPERQATPSPTGSAPRGVFISYQSLNDRGFVDLLYQELVRQLSRDLVFLAPRSIPAGKDYIQELKSQVRSAAVMLVVVDHAWLTTVGETGRQAINEAGFWIRRELSEAFAAGIRVIPILIDDADLPAFNELPSDIAELSRRQYSRLSRHSPGSIRAFTEHLTADVSEIATETQAIAESGDGSSGTRKRIPVDAPGMVTFAHSTPSEVPMNTRPDSTLSHRPARQVQLQRLPARAGKFTGRADELVRLKNATRDSRGVAILGVGGVGKSTLAVEFAHRHANDFSLVWWVAADSVTAVDAGLADLAAALDPNSRDLTVEQRIELTLTWLDNNTDWLIILDNLTTAADAKSLLDRVQTGTVLITSRYRGKWGEVHTLPLDYLSTAEAVVLLTHLAAAKWTGDDLHMAERLCEELGSLPLTIKQAGAYLAQTRITPNAYLNLLQRYPARRLTATVEDQVQHTVARVWSLVLDKLTDIPLAGHLLRQLAWYAPNNISHHLLTTGAAEPDLLLALGKLAAYSMITLNTDTINVHPQVQAVSRTADPDHPDRQPADIDHARDAATAALTSALDEADPRLPDHWPTFTAILPHAQALLDHADDATDNDTRCDLAGRLGQYFQEQGDTTTAITLLTRAARGHRRLDGPNHPSTLNWYTDLASAYSSAGDLTRAITLYEAVLADRERILGPDHPDTLSARNNLAYAYNSAGDLTRAFPLLEAVLADRERILGPDHPDTLSSRNNLAHTYRSAGDLTRAITLHEATLADRERILGPDHLDTLTSRNNLANAYELAGDPDRAITLHEATLADRGRILGPDHLDTLASRNNLASAYQSAGDLTRAITLHEATLADTERVLGPDHPSALASRNNLASAHESAGDLDRAITLYEAVLADRERILGPDHPDTLISRNNLASAYQSAGDLGRAITLHEAAFADTERGLGPRHPYTLSSRNNLAHAYESTGDLLRAITLYEATLADRERILGPDHPDTLTSRNNLAHAYESTGDLDRAITLHEATLADRERILGPHHPSTLTSRNNLAHAYRSTGDLDRAITLHEATLADRERILGPDHPDTLTSRNNLAHTYRSTGDLDRAITLLEVTLADAERVLGAEHPLTTTIRSNLEATTTHQTAPE